MKYLYFKWLRLIKDHKTFEKSKSQKVWDFSVSEFRFKVLILFFNIIFNEHNRLMVFITNRIEFDFFKSIIKIKYFTMKNNVLMACLSTFFDN